MFFRCNLFYFDLYCIWFYDFCLWFRVRNQRERKLAEVTFITLRLCITEGVLYGFPCGQSACLSLAKLVGDESGGEVRFFQIKKGLARSDKCLSRGIIRCLGPENLL